MNYCFTVTKHGMEGCPILAITSFDYNKIWKLWFNDLHLVLLYKFKHEYNDEGLKHVHYHGCLYSPNGRIEYKNLDVNGYSVKIENPYKTNYDRWHEYCMHEVKDQLKECKTTKDELQGMKILSSVMEAGQTYKTPKQTKITIKKKTDALFKIYLNI